MHCWLRGRYLGHGVFFLDYAMYMKLAHGIFTNNTAHNKVNFGIEYVQVGVPAIVLNPTHDLVMVIRSSPATIYSSGKTSPSDCILPHHFVLEVYHAIPKQYFR